VTRITYRCTASVVYNQLFEHVSLLENKESWIRGFLFLYNLSKKIPDDNIDHEILIHNSSTELMAIFEDDFDINSFDGARTEAQLSGLYFTLRIYKEFNIYNWKFFHLINQLVDERLSEIRNIDEFSGRVSYKNPQHYLFS